MLTDHSELFKQLPNIKGELEEKRWMLDRIIYEAYRFKRSRLADRLLDYKAKLTDAPLTNGTSSSADDVPSSSTASVNNSTIAKTSLTTVAPTVGHQSKLQSVSVLKTSTSAVTVHKEKVDHRS